MLQRVYAGYSYQTLAVRELKDERVFVIVLKRWSKESRLKEEK
jgi:hypothetical protein